MPDGERDIRIEAWYHESWFLALTLILFFPAGLILLWTARRIDPFIKLFITFLGFVFIIFPTISLWLLLILLGKKQLLPLHPLPIVLRAFSLPLAAILITILVFRYRSRVWLKRTLTVISVLLMFSGWGYFFINTPAWHSAWGNFYYERGKESKGTELYDKAIPHLQRAIQLRPLRSGPYFTLGNLYKRKKDYDRAIELLTKSVELAPDYPYGYVNLGYCYKKKGLFDRAIELYNKTIEVDGDSGQASQWAHYNLGNIYSKKKMTRQIIKHYRRAIELNPADEDAHYGLGVIYDDDEENYNKAIKHYRRVIELKPDHGRAHLNLGTVYHSKKMSMQAIEEYEKALSLPSYRTPYMAHYGLGCVYDDNEETYDKAIKHYRKAIELRPNYVDAHLNLGWVYAKLERYDEAVESYKEAIRIKPDYATAYYNLACIYSLVNDLDKAVEALRKALELGYDNFEHMSADTDLDNLRRDPRYKELISNIPGATLP